MDIVHAPVLKHFLQRTPPFVTSYNFKKSDQWHGLRTVSKTTVFPFQIKAVPKEVPLVDPLEAKRLAAEQLKQLEAAEKAKRQRKAEAINAGFATIGLLAGLLIEAQTGKSIISQVAGYFNTVVSFVTNHHPF